MKYITLVATLLSLSALNPLAANVHSDARECGPSECCPCPSWRDIVCNPCEGWSVYGDWLFWKVRRSDLDYCIDGRNSDSGLPDGDFKKVEPNYDHGFRLGVNKACGCWDYGLEYTHFGTTESNTTKHSDEEIIYATRNHPSDPSGLDQNTLNFASGRYENDLDLVNLELGYTYRAACADWRPYAGFQFAFIDQSMKSIYSDSFDPFASDAADGLIVKENLDMDAYLLYSGLRGTMDLFCNIKFFGEFSGAVGIANFESSFKEIEFDGGDEGDTLLDTSKDQWLGVSHIDASVGLSYDLCEFTCINWNVRLGYEFHQWCGMPDFINFTDDSNLGSNTRNKANLSYDGLFVRLTASF